MHRDREPCLQRLHPYRADELGCALQGLFVRHQLMFAAQLCMMVLQKKDALPGPKLEFLLRGPRKASCPANPVPEWLPNSCWAIVQCLQVGCLIPGRLGGVGTSCAPAVRSAGRDIWLVA